MSVSPDTLLKLNTDIGSRTNPSRTTTPAQSQADAGRFAELYAQQRQPRQPQAAAPERQETAPRPKPAERQEPAARAKPAERREAGAAERSSNAETRDTEQTPQTAGGDEKPAVAASGNALPAEEPATDQGSETDPLLMLGLAGQLPVDNAQAAAAMSVPGTAQALDEMPEEVSLEDLLGGLGDPLKKSTGKDEAVALASGSADPKGQAAAKSGDGFVATLLAVKGESEKDESLGDALALEDGLQALDGPKETRSATADALGARLNTLAQAVGQAQQAQRPAQVPGQPVPMQQNGWSEQVVDRVMWLSSQNLKSAEIQLDPQELGRLEVRIEMNKDQTQVTFLSPHAGVRDALEAQSQRLRDLFTQQGMNLLDVNVSDQSLARGSQGQGGDGQGRGRGGLLGEGGDTGDERLLGTSEISADRTGGDRGLVDYYA
ncbi:flagellar hook-length control protein FliK [Stutzerimonas azotifigens]|uniref:flagellar hook-length control protein FliK n=1 Tax=Stutzerimonas azotifigens TaxID=291995 RepID=UPI00041E8AD7|nr:flagellar hook-length control protein FliK [Stutzerimonas azotifigens]